MYADWAHAKGKTGANTTRLKAATATLVNNAGVGNFYGGGVTAGQKWDGYSVRATVEPIERVVALIGYGYNKTATANPATDVKNTMFQIGAQYAIYQNMEVKLVYNSTKTTTGNVSSKVNTTTLEVEALM
ncbi:hypothetical protein D6833_07645 [Candidatus Parcubacteria bacterium]|nr:MAG: hypothetical protein D6833_07645 [Candidatus Parcubacteria bacterium]